MKGEPNTAVQVVNLEQVYGSGATAVAALQGVSLGFAAGEESPRAAAWWSLG